MNAEQNQLIAAQNRAIAALHRDSVEGRLSHHAANTRRIADCHENIAELLDPRDPPRTQTINLTAEQTDADLAAIPPKPPESAELGELLKDFAVAAIEYRRALDEAGGMVHLLRGDRVVSAETDDQATRQAIVAFVARQGTEDKTTAKACLNNVRDWIERNVDVNQWFEQPKRGASEVAILLLEKWKTENGRLTREITAIREIAEERSEEFDSERAHSRALADKAGKLAADVNRLTRENHELREAAKAETGEDVHALAYRLAMEWWREKGGSERARAYGAWYRFLLDQTGEDAPELDSEPEPPQNAPEPTEEPERKPDDVYCARTGKATTPDSEACQPVLSKWRTAPPGRGLAAMTRLCRQCEDIRTEPGEPLEEAGGQDAAVEAGMREMGFTEVTEPDDVTSGEDETCEEPQPDPPATDGPETLPELSEEMRSLMRNVINSPTLAETNDIHWPALKDAIRHLEANQIDATATCGECARFVEPEPPTVNYNCGQTGNLWVTRSCVACVKIQRKPAEPEVKARFFRGETGAMWVYPKEGQAWFFSGNHRDHWKTDNSPPQGVGLRVEITYDQALAILTEADWPEGLDKLREMVGEKL